MFASEILTTQCWHIDALIPGLNGHWKVNNVVRLCRRCDISGHSHSSQNAEDTKAVPDAASMTKTFRSQRVAL